jgi:hypothetical protein
MQILAAIKTLMAVYEFLRIIAPLISQIYDAVRQLFPEGTPGAVKLDTFRAMVRQLLDTTEELKKFAPIFEQAWPMLHTMLEAFHSNEKARAAAPVAQVAVSQ